MSYGRRIAVVGGGPAGLSAAYRLARGGLDVTVFEARRWIGGRMRTDEVDGYRIDTFTQLVGSSYTAFFQLLREIGGGELVRRSPGRDALWRGGRAHEVVYGSVTSMLASGALPLRTKLRLGATYLPFLTRHASSLDLHAPARAAEAGLDAETVAAWGERELGSDFVELLAYPLLAAYYGVTPEQTGTALYHLLARTGMDVSVSSLRGGMGRFCELLAERVNELGGTVRTAAAVRGLARAGDRLVLQADSGSEEFDGAVVCVPGTVVPQIVELDGPARVWFQDVRYQPIAALALLLERPVAARYFGLSFPRTESRSVAAVCVQENKDPELVPPGRGLLVVLPAPESVTRFLEDEPSDVVTAVLPDLRRAFPGVERSILRAKLYRYVEGGPVFYPGYLDHLRAFQTGGVEPRAAITFGGDYLQLPTVEGSIVSGTAAAERLQLQWSA